MQKFIDMEIVDPIIIFYDNKSSIKLCRTLKMNHQVRHINIKSILFENV